MIEGFEVAVASWLERAQAGVKAYHDRLCPNLPGRHSVLEVMRGPRYWRVVAVTDGQRSAFAFLDTKSGDVLKPAGWKGPAKHARGNVLSGPDGVSGSGAHYLR